MLRPEYLEIKEKYVLNGDVSIFSIFLFQELKKIIKRIVCVQVFCLYAFLCNTCVPADPKRASFPLKWSTGDHSRALWESRQYL